MEVLLVFMVLLAMGFGIGLLYLISIIKNGEYDKTIKILTILIQYGLFLFIFLEVVMSILFIVYMGENGIVIFHVVKEIIVVIFYILIYIEALQLLTNLKSNIIFHYGNVDKIKQIGLYFLYLAVTEIIVGMVLGLLTMESLGNFEVATNNVIFVYVVMGLILQVISVILGRATEIYEENQLTI